MRLLNRLKLGFLTAILSVTILPLQYVMQERSNVLRHPLELPVPSAPQSCEPFQKFRNCCSLKTKKRSPITRAPRLS